VETLTSKEAADLLGLPNVQAWHRLVAREGLVPVKELPGIRGAKFWRVSDVVRLAGKHETSAVA